MISVLDIGWDLYFHGSLGSFFIGNFIFSNFELIGFVNIDGDIIWCGGNRCVIFIDYACARFIRVEVIVFRWCIFWEQCPCMEWDGDLLIG